MPYSVKGFFEINEDMVQILLMLGILFTQDSKVKDLNAAGFFGQIHFVYLHFYLCF